MKVIQVVKTIAVLFVLAAVVYCGYLLFRGTNITVPILFKPAAGERLLLSMDGFQFSQATGTKTTWQMVARNADLYENKQAKLKEIEITFNSPDNSRQARLLGETATMDTVTGDASVHGDTKEVRIITSDGYLLKTNSLFWKAGEQLVWTPEPFKLLGREIYLEGVGLSAYADMRSLVVKNHVMAVLQE
ncbi:MAG TPA: LPS export ABC transporter periplasmic protein LptC [Nitrospirota bacterium]|nr:LPS export ABC transporter periplasmic protein LptC [Nitrospirota bacterium]